MMNDREKKLRPLGLLAGLVLGAVFLLAAWAKAIDPMAFAEQIQNEGLEILLPAPLLAGLMVVLEAVLGVALVLGLRRRWVTVPTGGLIVLFLFLTGRAYWRFLHGIEDPSACGCFGNLVNRTPAEAFWQDLLLLVPPFLIAVWLRRAGVSPSRWRVVVVAAIAVAVGLFVWRSPSLPLDDLATRLKPGVEIAALCAGSSSDAGERACLDLILPEFLDGSHLVVIDDLESPALGENVEYLNDLAQNLQSSDSSDPGASAAGPGTQRVWLLHDSTPEVQTAFFWQWGPAFELREVPAGLLRPLYRSRPRSFEIEDGRVIQTWAGYPPPVGDQRSAGVS